VLVHVIDLAAPEDPLAQYALLRRELELHDPALLRRTVLVALNKIDLPEARDRLAPTTAALAARGVPAIGVSGATGLGVERLLLAAADALAAARAGEETPAGVKN
jgi:GTP-binding protein